MLLVLEVGLPIHIVVELAVVLMFSFLFLCSLSIRTDNSNDDTLSEELLCTNDDTASVVLLVVVFKVPPPVLLFLPWPPIFDDGA